MLREALEAGSSSSSSSFATEHTSAVCELCISQVETSDIILLNKIDLVSTSDVDRIEAMVRSLNPRAR